MPVGRGRKCKSFPFSEKKNGSQGFVVYSLSEYSVTSVLHLQASPCLTGKIIFRLVAAQNHLPASVFRVSESAVVTRRGASN